MAEWKLPHEPGPEVEAVRVVATGQRWNRLASGVQPDAFRDHWIVDNPAAVQPPQVLDWPGLLVHGRHLEITEPIWVRQGALDTGSYEGDQ